MPWPKFTKQEDIPEGFRELYEEKDGEWVPKDVGDSDDDRSADVERLNEALRKEREAKKAAEKQVKDLDARIKDLETKAKADKAGITDEQLTKLREEIRADLEGEYKEHQTKAEQLTAENRALKLDNQVKALAGKHGVRAERIEAWWRQFGDRFDLTDDGKPIVKDHPGTDVAKFISGDLKKELPDFYTGTQAAGGGAGGMQKDGWLVGGTTAEDIMKNPEAALQAARDKGE